MATLLREIIEMILVYLPNVRDRAAAQLTCRSWNEIIKKTLAQFLEYRGKGLYGYNLKTLIFKITRLRFLVRKRSRLSKSFIFCKGLTNHYPPIRVIIHNYGYINKTKVKLAFCVFTLNAISENERFICYETDEALPDWHLSGIMWEAHVPEYIPIGQNNGGRVFYNKVAALEQDTGTDLCYQMFKTGLAYASPNEITIGCNYFDLDIICCCTIKLIP